MAVGLGAGLSTTLGTCRSGRAEVCLTTGRRWGACCVTSALSCLRSESGHCDVSSHMLLGRTRDAGKIPRLHRSSLKGHEHFILDFFLLQATARAWSGGFALWVGSLAPMPRQGWVSESPDPSQQACWFLRSFSGTRCAIYYHRGRLCVASLAVQSERCIVHS